LHVLRGRVPEIGFVQDSRVTRHAGRCLRQADNATPRERGCSNKPDKHAIDHLLSLICTRPPSKALFYICAMIHTKNPSVAHVNGLARKYSRIPSGGSVPVSLLQTSPAGTTRNSRFRSRN